MFRNPGAPPAGKTLLLVTPAYPLRMARVDAAALQRYQGKALRSVTFESLAGDWADFELDGLDAFFLPWNHLDRVARPGPHLRLVLLTG